MGTSPRAKQFLWEPTQPCSGFVGMFLAVGVLRFGGVKRFIGWSFSIGVERFGSFDGRYARNNCRRPCAVFCREAVGRITGAYQSYFFTLAFRPHR